MSFTRLFYTAFVALVLHAPVAMANNIQVTNVSLTDNGSFTAVNFDISWENSWRGVGMPNWDAAWVFVKYRDPAGVWRHANLDLAGHNIPGAATFEVGVVNEALAYNATTNPAVGGFLYRSAEGSGTFSLAGVRLIWPYAAQGVTFSDIAQVQVFAIEMVYVEQGEFACARQFLTLTTINTAAANTPPAGIGSLGGSAGGYPTGTSPPNPAFPNGFSAFYSMKYEVSQRGYVDFLNTLTYDQQASRTAFSPGSPAGNAAMASGNGDGNGIDIEIPGVASTIPAIYACNLNGNAVFNEAADGSDLNMNYMSGTDLIAYLDWSGLRPMTEMEYDKACRGTALVVPGEFVWGTNTRTTGGYTRVDIGLPNEGVTAGYSTTVGNYWNGFNNGAARVGLFAANPGNSGRVTAGATFYGIMDMGSHTAEQAVHVRGDAHGYTGVHGNGALNGGGGADTPGWPPHSNGFQWSGGWGNGHALASVGCGTSSPCTTGRDANTGGRGVRSAP